MTREMKDSGIEWIGQIPKEWDIFKVKDGFFQKKSKANIENPTILSLARDGVKIRDISNNEGQIAADYSQYNPVEPGDMLLNPMDLYSGANCSLSKVSGVISPVYVNLKAKKDFSAEFYDYYFKYQYWSMAFFSYGKGVSFDNRWTLNNETLMRFPLITPCFEEQVKIARYLNSKCSQIDSILTSLQDQIDTLEQYKKSAITETVTKGLNPDVEMKDSGVEWIGTCPKAWDIKPFKFVLNERCEKNNPIKTSERLSLSIDKGVTLYADKTTNLDRFKDDVSQYKLAYKGDFVMNSMNMIVGAFDISPYYGCVSPAYYVFFDNTKDHIVSRFCNYYFKMKPILKVFHSLGKGILAIDRGDDRINTCRLKVSRYDLNKIPVLLPDIEEQRQIVDYLDNKCSQIDSIITQKKEQIETLKEYKKSLIYEYVTGKKEVPNA